MKAFKLGLKVAAVAGLSALLSVSALAGIANSKHDLREGATGGGTTFAGATEICVFCHTPHGSQDNSVTSAPLWNRIIGTQSRTTYTSSTLDGEVTLAGSPSLACLSCHDGQQAMNTVINAPSSTTDYNYDSTKNTGFRIGTVSTGGEMSTTVVANLGTDLSNDHPVGMPYAGGGLTGTSSIADFADGDFKLPDYNADIGGQAAWWVEFDGSNATVNSNDGSRTKSDIILYTRTVASVTTGYVECASCHDPHAGEKISFLRPSDNLGNAKSQVCLACHDK